MDMANKKDVLQLIQQNINFILVGTTHPGNIGAAARAMKNMGISQMGLVSPREFPHEKAFFRAKAATDVLEKAIEHLDIIYSDMISIFKKNNIEEIKAIDKKLDPNLHQAMLEIEDEEKEPGTVVNEIQKGFMIKDRLLRPSLVAVSKKPTGEEEKLAFDEKDKQNQPKKEEN